MTTGAHIAAIRSHPGAYADHWGGGPPSLMLRSTLLSIPLEKRRYAPGPYIAKSVRIGEHAGLCESSEADIAQESYGAVGRRTLVAFEDAAESIEKSLYCYSKGSLPIVAELHPEVMDALSHRIPPDSCIADQVALERLAEYFASRASPLSSLAIIGERLEPTERIRTYAADITFILALPETGAIAAANYAPELRFRPLPDVIIEDSETLVITIARERTTPIIRYDTGISIVQRGDGFSLVR